MVDLSVEVCGVRFRNPVMPAAGPPKRDGRAPLACAEGGAGGLVSNTMSVRAADVSWPNMAEIPHGMLNTETWSIAAHGPVLKPLAVRWPVGEAIQGGS